MPTLVSPPQGGMLKAPTRKGTGGGARPPTESLCWVQWSWRGPISPSFHLLKVNTGASGVAFGKDCMTTAGSGASRLHRLTRKRGGEHCSWAALNPWLDVDTTSKADGSVSSAKSQAAKSKSISHAKNSRQNEQHLENRHEMEVEPKLVMGHVEREIISNNCKQLKLSGNHS